MIDIIDVTLYTRLLCNGFAEKLFWVDKLFKPWDTLVDFGCADGYMPAIIADIFPDKNILGYDNDVSMIDRSLYHTREHLHFTSSLTGALACPDVIVFNSVIHEVYSYYTPLEITDFWDRIFNSGSRYLVFRDMMYSERLASVTGLQSRSYIANTAGKREGEREMLMQFEKRWGDVYNKREFLHWLLKYKYQENWERELQENYLPLSVERFREMVPAHYRIEYFNHEPLPFLRHQWEEDYGIVVNDPTHAKIILKLK